MKLRKCFYMFSCLFLFPFIDYGQDFNTVKSNNIHFVSVIKYDTVQNDFIPIKDSMKINPIYLPEEHTYLFNTSKNYSLPLKNLKVTSQYGIRFHPLLKKVMLHNGIDFSAHADTVYSILPGRVTKAAFSPTLGFYLEISHGILSSIYGHLSVIFLQVNEIAEIGKPIAITGNTGRSTHEHLHFIVKYKNETINPNPILQLLYQKELELVSNKVLIPSLSSSVLKFEYFYNKLKNK